MAKTLLTDIDQSLQKCFCSAKNYADEADRYLWAALFILLATLKKLESKVDKMAVKIDAEGNVVDAGDSVDAIPGKCGPTSVRKFTVASEVGSVFVNSDGTTTNTARIKGIFTSAFAGGASDPKMVIPNGGRADLTGLLGTPTLAMPAGLPYAAGQVLYSAPDGTMGPLSSIQGNVLWLLLTTVRMGVVSADSAGKLLLNIAIGGPGIQISLAL